MQRRNDPLRQIESLISNAGESLSGKLKPALDEAREQLGREGSGDRREDILNAEVIANASLTVDDLQEILQAVRQQLVGALEQRAESDVSSRSQYEVILNSAEIIAELEETKFLLEESHQAERQAKLEAERLAGFGKILDSADNEIYLFDYSSLKFVYANQGGRRNSGYSMEELREMTPLDLKPELNADSFEHRVMPLRAGAVKTIQLSTVHQRKDGSRYPVEIHLHRDRFEGQEVFVAMVTDITQKEAAQRQIHKLSIAVEQSPVSIMITDAEGNVEYVNEMYREMSGYAWSEVYGRTASFFCSDRGRYAEQAQRWATLRSGEVWRGEMLNEKKSGEQYWEALLISPISSSKGIVTNYLAVGQDITQRKHLADELKMLAMQDTLTGLPNRHSILNSIQDAIDQGDQNCFALLFLDFDRFKLINDSLGHEAGDELLRQISLRLQKNLREHDDVVPARLGGDEFVVLLRGLKNCGEATRIAERLLHVFAESYQIQGHQVHSTASIGVVTNEQEHSSAKEMLRDADLAMYEAKASGKACYVLFDQTMHEKAQRRLQLECELHGAIAREEFLLEYQPIVSLETSELLAVEALVRWEHPQQGRVRPDDFIPIAEETGLIVPLGHWIIQEACRQFAKWRRSLGSHSPKCVHVNVSRKQMLMPELIDCIEATLLECDLPAHCLHLEITESSIMGDPAAVIATIETLRKLGVQIDMDDFGTGYSSLACLHKFPIDVLKIDRGFIDSDANVRDYAALLHAIVNLAENLGLQVVVEGIETHDQVATLQALGCDMGQGYFFSKPLSPKELEKYAKERSHSQRQLPNASDLGPPLEDCSITSMTSGELTP